MPLTPLHPLALMFLYFKDKKRIDPLALAVSATFIDLETLYYLLIREPLDHMIWHGFALALTVYPILVTIGVYMVEHFFEGKLRSAYNVLWLKPIQVRYSLSTIYLCSLIGGASHIFFDMFTHENMPYVIYPLANGNPFYIGAASIIVEVAVILLAIYSLLNWIKGKQSHLKPSPSQKSTFSFTSENVKLENDSFEFLVLDFTVVFRAIAPKSICLL